MTRGVFDTNYTRCLVFLVLVLSSTRVTEDLLCIFFDPFTQRGAMIQRAGHVEWQAAIGIAALAAMIPLALATIVKFRTRRVRCFARIAMAGLSCVAAMWLSRIYLAQDAVLRFIDTQTVIDTLGFLAVVLSIGALLNRQLIQACGNRMPRGIDLDRPNTQSAPLMPD